MSPASLSERCPRLSSAAHTIVTIKVGRGKKAYYIYEDLLTHCSGYFRAALAGSFKEAKEKQLHLEDVTKKTFDAFVDWLFLQNFPRQKKLSYAGDELSNTNKNGNRKSSLNSYEITKIHIFADRYDIPDLRRDTIDMMFTYFKNGGKIPAAEAITIAFESLPNTSLLRKLLVHRYCQSESNVTPEDESLWTHEIFHAVLARYRDIIRDRGESFNLYLCDYHDHANDQEEHECRREQEWWSGER